MPDERPTLSYFTPGRKPVAAAWWHYLIGFALFLGLGALILSVL